jgi:hypothetical protein
LKGVHLFGLVWVVIFVAYEHLNTWSSELPNPSRLEVGILKSRIQLYTALPYMVFTKFQRKKLTGTSLQMCALRWYETGVRGKEKMSGPV